MAVVICDVNQRCDMWASVYHRWLLHI